MQLHLPINRPVTLPIPREILFGNPDEPQPANFTDGKYLTYIAPWSEKNLQVWLRTMGQ